MNPDKRYLEIKEYDGEGYRPCIDYGGWRVAILRYITDLEAANIDAMERHNETDEVFVLLSGRCILYIGEGDGDLETIHAVDMVPEKIYNIKRGVYHSHTLSRDAVVLIVENRDTGPTNSDRISLINEQRREIITLTQSLWGREALNQP